MKSKVRDVTYESHPLVYSYIFFASAKATKGLYIMHSICSPPLATMSNMVFRIK